MSIYTDLLYHTVLTVIDYHADPSGANRSVFVLGTHASLPAAKSFASRALQDLNYQPDDFSEYAVRPSPSSEQQDWNHPDGVLVHARAPAGQVLETSIDTTPNNESLLASPSGSLVLPKGAELLHYVVQTTVDYDADRTGAQQDSHIEGCYVLRADALAAARRCLDSSNFVEFDARDELDGEWPFGDDVVVHAVAETGQNTTVAVRTVPGAHKRHGKKH